MRQYIKYYQAGYDPDKIEFFTNEKRIVCEFPEWERRQARNDFRTLICDLIDLVNSKIQEESGDKRMKVRFDGYAAGFDMDDKEYQTWIGYFRRCSKVAEYNDYTFRPHRRGRMAY